MSKPIEQYAVKTASLKPAGSLSGSYRNVVPLCHYERAVARIAELEEQLSSADVQPAGGAVPDGWMLVERSIWTESQVDSAAKSVEIVQGIPGATARDIAMAAMDAAQCKAPDVTLFDLLAAAPHPVSGEQKADALRKRFSDIEDEIMAGKHNAASVFTAMRTAALYIGKPSAQDVAGLVEMLDSMVCAYRSVIATGYDRITGLGGQCDAVDYMLAAFPDYAKAKAMVAAHRAQQGEQPS